MAYTSNTDTESNIFQYSKTQVTTDEIGRISDLKGIEFFKGLTWLEIDGLTSVTELNLSGYTYLQQVDILNSNLNTLTVTNCPNLTIINTDETSPQSDFYLIKATSLHTVDVSNANSNVSTIDVPSSVTSLKASGMTGLQWIRDKDGNNGNVSVCRSLTTLDVSGCTSLTPLNVSGCKNLTTLNVTGCTSLTALNISSCTALTALDVTSCTALTSLNATGCTALTALDVKNCKSLTSLGYYCTTKVTGYSSTGYSLIVYAKQLILDGSLNMAFYVPMSDAELSDGTTKTASFKIGSSEAIEGTFRSDLSLKGHIDSNGDFEEINTDVIDNKVTLYAFVSEITSIQMADAITADITVGAKAVTFEGYTVKKYLSALTASSSYSGNAKALANSVGAYGYYAQITLKETNTTSYGTHTDMDEPAEGYTVTAQTAAQTTYSTHAMKILDEAGTNEVTENPPSVTYTLDLDSKTTLHVYLPSGSSLRDKDGYTGINAISTKSSTYEINASNVTTQNITVDSTTYFDIAFSDIAAHELADIFTIPVTIDSTEYTIQISAMSYVNSVISKSNTDLISDVSTITTDDQATHLKQAVLALDNYREKINIYRTPSNN